VRSTRALVSYVPGLDLNLQNQSPLILCIINGDENVFPKSLLVQGQTGGRQAAQLLTKAVAGYLANEDLQVLGRLSFWITVYYNKRNLLELLLDNELCAAEQLEAFLSGFSETSPRFSMVDVGFSKGSTASKVIGTDLVRVWLVPRRPPFVWDLLSLTWDDRPEHVQTQVRYPQTLRVFLGCKFKELIQSVNACSHGLVTPPFRLFGISSEWERS
jgi:hypothetical protein